MFFAAVSLAHSPPSPDNNHRLAKVIPGSDLLRVAHADLEERRGRVEEADRVWKAYLRDHNSTTGHVMYLRYYVSQGIVCVGCC